MLHGFLWASTESERIQCYFIRKKVFMEEQGFEHEFDEIDDRAHHLLFLDDQAPVATARLFLEGGSWVIGRVCVLQKYRGTGVGRLLVQECVNKARELGQSNTVILNAQEQAKGFYQQLGFCETGKKEVDEGCPHVEMSKSLT